MEKERHTFLGQYSNNGSDESNAINQALTRLRQKYGEEVFNLQDGMEGTGNVEIQFTADASTAKDALNDFMNEIRTIQEQYGESDVLTSLSIMRLVDWKKQMIFCLSIRIYIIRRNRLNYILIKNVFWKDCFGMAEQI